MGYTHYWYRTPKIEQAAFIRVVHDFKRLVPIMAEYGVKLANGIGVGEPTLTDDDVKFNGLENCGHPQNEMISIPWPSMEAGGVSNSFEAHAGDWFAGATLESRCCNGDCSYETFSFPKKLKIESYMAPENGKYFDCTKTAFRPYDLAVTAFLVVAKHHLGDELIVQSDGEDVHWFDAKMLCQMELGYGMDFKIG